MKEKINSMKEIISINSVKPCKDHEALLAALLTQESSHKENSCIQKWVAKNVYPVTFKNQIYPVVLTDSMIKRFGKTGNNRYETLDGKPIGDGSYANVYPIKATWTVENGQLVNKDHDYEKLAKVFSDKYLELLKGYAEKEYDMAKKTPHLHPKKPIYDEKNVYLIFRRMEGKELFDVLEPDLKCSSMSLEKRWDLSLGLLKALYQQVIACDLVHRDIKPENIIVDINDAVKVNIIDYGLSKIMNTHPEVEKLGTKGFMSPESIKNENTTPASDLFSMGIVLAILWHVGNFKILELKKSSEILKIIEKNEPVRLFCGLEDNINAQAQHIITNTISQMLASVPQNRISFEQAYQNFIDARNQQFPSQFMANDLVIKKAEVNLPPMKDNVTPKKVEINRPIIEKDLTLKNEDMNPSVKAKDLQKNNLAKDHIKLGFFNIPKVLHCGANMTKRNVVAPLRMGVPITPCKP